MTLDPLTPSKAAYKLTKIIETVSAAHGLPRFPIDVAKLALDAAHIFKWDDPIVEVQAASINKFEGALVSDDARTRWLLLFNDQLQSPGRIRFTQAHELGHYLLHRTLRDEFRCSTADMLDSRGDDKTIESQADSFASTLLMPLDDFRQQMPTTPSLEALGVAAERYGVSLTAAALRWIHHTEATAVLLVHRDGFIDWACSSKSAFAGGAFFKSKSTIVPVPEGSLAADSAVLHERLGRELPAQVWFPNAEPHLSLREMKICADQFDFVLTLLVLPRGERVWKPFKTEDALPVADVAQTDRQLPG